MNIEVFLPKLKQNEQVALIKLYTTIREHYKVSEEMIPSASIFRFLQSRNNDVEESVKGILESVEWRKTANWQMVRDIDVEFISDFMQMVKFGFYGEDPKGRPVRIMQPQKVDYGDFFKKHGSDRLFAFQLSLIERLINIVFEMCSKKYGKPVHNVITIIDVKDLEVTQILTNGDLLGFAKNRSSEFQKNYPELTHRALIINAGPIFYTLWKIFSLFLNKKTLERIKICNDDFMEEYLKIQTIDKIPVCFGGKCIYEIDNYPNFHDQELNLSIKEKRIILKK